MISTMQGRWDAKRERFTAPVGFEPREEARGHDGTLFVREAYARVVRIMSVKLRDNRFKIGRYVGSGVGSLSGSKQVLSLRILSRKIERRMMDEAKVCGKSRKEVVESLRVYYKYIFRDHFCENIWTGRNIFALCRCFKFQVIRLLNSQFQLYRTLTCPYFIIISL